MDKAFLQKLDESEQSRVHALVDDTQLNQKSVSSLFKSNTVKEVVEKGNQAIIDGFDIDVLTNTIPFSDRVFLQICPSCKCVANPSLLKPFLERDLVVPVFDAFYRHYKPEFVELILSYPHISYSEFYSLRNTAICRENKTIDRNKVIHIENATLDLIQKSTFSDTAKKKLYERTVSIYYNLQPFLYSDKRFFDTLLQSIKSNNYKETARLFSLSCLIDGFRNSQAFSFIPQVETSELELAKLSAINQQMTFDVTDIKNTVLTGLKLSYNPTATSTSIDEYLDIIASRKQKIRKIVTDIVNQANPEKEYFLSNLQKEIEKMNQEVESIEASNRRRVIHLFTNFSMKNKGSIIAALMASAATGLAGVGFLGYGAAGIASGAITKVLSSNSKLSIPKEAKELNKSLSEWVEPSYEKILAKELSVNVQAIQVWNLQQKLRNNKKPKKTGAQNEEELG